MGSGQATSGRGESNKNAGKASGRAQGQPALAAAGEGDGGPPPGQVQDGGTGANPVPVDCPGGAGSGKLPPDRYLERDESWLRFNQRVLELAEDETIPLLERVRFLAIFASNLDEFFMVRVAGRVRRMAAGLPVDSASGMPPEQALENILTDGRRARQPTCRLFQRLSAACPGRGGHRDPALEAARGRGAKDAAPAVPGADLPGAHAAGR